MITPVMPTYARANLAFEKGEGPYLYAQDGRRFLDFGSGIAVNTLGIRTPHLVEKLTEQVGKLWHTSNLYQMPGQEKLAKRLIANSFADTCFSVTPVPRPTRPASRCCGAISMCRATRKRTVFWLRPMRFMAERLAR